MWDRPQCRDGRDTEVPPTLFVRLRGGFVAALQDRVVKIGCVGLTRVEGDDDALALKIDSDIFDADDFHQRRAQSADAFVAIFAFRRDLDRFEDGVIGAFGILRVLWLELAWSRWVHQLSL